MKAKSDLNLDLDDGSGGHQRYSISLPKTCWEERSGGGILCILTVQIKINVILQKNRGKKITDITDCGAKMPYNAKMP